MILSDALTLPISQLHKLGHT